MLCGSLRRPDISNLICVTYEAAAAPPPPGLIPSHLPLPHASVISVCQLFRAIKICARIRLSLMDMLAGRRGGGAGGAAVGGGCSCHLHKSPLFIGLVQRGLLIFDSG